jgi:hypothetical protein
MMVRCERVAQDIMLSHYCAMVVRPGENTSTLPPGKKKA